MALEFITHTIPHELNMEPNMEEKKRIQISKRLGKTNRKLQSRMKAIERREKKSWQLSLKRN